MPTISVRRFCYDTLKANLKPDDRIVIVSCDSCARQSDGLGGEDGLNSLADKLVADGFNVVHRQLLPVACSAHQLTDRLQEAPIRKLFEEADIVIPLSCQAGEERASQTLANIRILGVTRALDTGSVSPERGTRLTKALDGVEIEIDSPEGISTTDAAKQLGLYSGSF